MSRVWATSIVPAGRKLVAMKLADSCDDVGGSLFPSMSSVADACNMSRSQAQRHMRALMKDGLLSVIANAAGGAPGTVPDYQLHIERLAEPKRARGSVFAIPGVGADATVGMHATGSADASEGSQGRASGVASMRTTGSADATQTTINHQVTVNDPKNGTANKLTHLPAGFAISDQVRAWSAEKGFTDLDLRLEAFVGYAKANGARYCNWDEALKNSIRGNWAKIESKPFRGGTFAVSAVGIFDVTKYAKVIDV